LELTNNNMGRKKKATEEKPFVPDESINEVFVDVPVKKPNRYMERINRAIENRKQRKAKRNGEANGTED